MIYPKTKKNSATDNYFGHTVEDPYRWLEDDTSEETAAWVKEQNKTTDEYLSTIPFLGALKDRLETLWNYEKLSAPFKEGVYTYFYKNDGLQNQYILYRNLDNEVPTIFLNPNTFSEDGTTSLAGLSFTEDGSLATYLISEKGSDWRKAITINTATKEGIEAPLINIKFSGISWYGNEGFYYASYDKPEGSELTAKTQHHKIYYHKLGTPQAEDLIIFGNTPEEQHRYCGAYVTRDNRYLIISAATTTSGNKLFIKDLNGNVNSLKSIVTDTASDTYVIDNVGSTLFLVTNRNAPNKKLISVDASQPQPENWTTVIPETAHVLSLSKGGNSFFASYMVHAISKVFQYTYKGEKIREIALPGIGSIGGFSCKRSDAACYFSFTNYNTPNTLYKYQIADGTFEKYWAPAIAINSQEYCSTQVFYTATDGAKIPMIITHKKGMKLDGKNPTILYGYGGFNVSLTPSFSVANAVWMEQGGIYAVPNIRGGGEYGKEWHNAGTKMNKQQVFDDFIAAIQYLTDHKYSSKKYMAIRGGSNGGLLVGATMTQRPDLVQVALPAVGVLDMLRYHTFTSGAGWQYDYGTAEDSETMFLYLKAYSPLHNVKQCVEYPATFITTGDHDDRVVPAHSFKFAATLQEKQAGSNPALIHIETNAGHGAGTPVSKTIKQYAAMFAFTLFNMGYNSLPKF